MITFERFLWLIHSLLIAGYIFEIGRFLYLRIQYKDLFKQASDTTPHIFEQEWNAWGGTALGFGFAHVIAFATYSRAVPLFLIILVIGWIYCEVRSDAMKPYIKAYKRDHPKQSSHRFLPSVAIVIGCVAISFVIGALTTEGNKKAGYLIPLGVIVGMGISGFLNRRYEAEKVADQKARQERDAHQRTHDQTANDDGNFGFDEKAWKGNGSARASTEKSKPYGTEKHHPDDAALWNIVNDPNASEGEQLNALRAINKKEAKRQGK